MPFRQPEVEKDVGVLAAVDSFNWAVLTGTYLSMPFLSYSSMFVQIDKNEVFISSPDMRYKIPEGVKITQLALIASTGYCLSGRHISLLVCLLSFVDII